MTRIDFYTHAPDKLPVVLQLVRKAWDRRLKVWIRVSSDSLAQELDQYLWTHPAGGFIPHCLAESTLAPETPILIDGHEQEPLSAQFLINLHAEHSIYFSRFERLAEIVTLNEDDRRAARLRYLHYRDRGFEIRSHNLSQPNSTHDSR